MHSASPSSVRPHKLVDVALVFSDARFWLFTLAGVALATLLAGAYPALTLSRVRPLWAMQSRDARGGGRSVVSALLVGIQFAAASFLLITIFVMQQQAADLRRASLAASSDPLIVIANTKAFTGIDSVNFEDELRALPSVKAVAGMSNPPWSGGDARAITLMTDSRDPSSLKSAVMTGVDYGFFATMNMRSSPAACSIRRVPTEA
jgi:putative ABC transport system permease protein